MSNATQVPASRKTVPARDGYALGATVYELPTAVRGTVVVSSATGVPQDYYRHFAGFLAEAGYRVVTYDYRGIGRSKPASLRGFPARMRDWALLDAAGVIDWVPAQYPGPLFVVGHSVGGQTAGLLDNAHAIDGLITVSAQSGHWRLQGGRQPIPVCLHTWITLPLLSRLAGYMPWSLFAAGEDLPKGVAVEWARWCRNRNYLLGDTSLPLHRYAAFASPVLAYSVDDDDWGTARSVDAMMSAYPTVERRHLIPSDRGLVRLGHMGYFRPDSRPLWEEAHEWLQTVATTAGNREKPASAA